MAYEEGLKSFTFDADGTIGFYTGVPGNLGSASPNGGAQYHLVKVTGQRQAGLAVDAGDKIIGVLQNKPQAPGAPATVATEGITKLIAGAAVAVDANLVADSTGRAITGTPEAGGKVLRAITAAAGANEVFSAIFE